MSGRFTLGKDPRKLAVHFDVAAPPWDHPRYNVAPSQDIIIVRGDENVGREAVLTQWGSVPSWSKDPDEGPRPINAKAETVATSPAFRSPFKKRRCLIPANGFFEWAATGKVKTPYHFRLKDRGLFAFAGLWEHWKHENRDPLETSTIITTEANDVVRPIHARMPVILDPNEYDRWLDPSTKSEELAALLRPFPAEDLEAFAVSWLVNNPRTDDPTASSRLDVARSCPGPEPASAIPPHRHPKQHPDISTCQSVGDP